MSQKGRLAAVVFLVALFVVPLQADDPAGAWRVPMGLKPGWYARIETSMGEILARLLPEQAPQSVAHFAAMAEGRLEWTDVVEGETHQGHYYDGSPIHRIRPGVLFEAGAETAEGIGAPMMFVPREEGTGPVNFSRPGRLGLTRVAGGKVSAVAFFVTAASEPRFNRRHPCFGELISGKEAVYQISTRKAYSNGKPVEPLKIELVRIFRVGDPPPLPEPVPYWPKPAKFSVREDSPEEP